MPNNRQPEGGECVSGPLNLLHSMDNSYVEFVDAQGVADGPQIPYVYNTKPVIATAGTPSNGAVLRLCQLLAPIVAREIARQSAFATRVTLLPQQQPAAGYSPGNVYNYTFGSTAVSITVNTRQYVGEKVPVDVTLGNPTLTADLARRLAGGLQGGLDNAISSLWPQFSTNAPQGTGGSGNPLGGTAAALALLSPTGEPVFQTAYQAQMGLTNHGTVANGLVNEFFYPTATVQTLANGNAPSFPALGPGLWVLTTPFVKQTGSAPVTTHNVMFTPSAIGLVFETETNINNTATTPFATQIATGSFGNITVTVWALNTGSGVQAIYASISYGYAAGITANAVQVSS